MTLDPIQVLWVRGDLSRVELLSLRSFVAQGHPVHFYTYEAPAIVPDGVQILNARLIVDEDLAPIKEAQPFGKGSYACFSDFFRYKLLHAHGGWWADLDVVAIRPWFDFPEVVVASTREKNWGLIANNFAMRFPIGHRVLSECLKSLSLEKLSEVGFGESGPILLNSMLGPDGVRLHAQPPEIFCPVPWNAPWQLLRARRQRFSLSEMKQRLRRPHLSMRFTKKTAAVHLWNESWRANGWDKNAHYHPSCLYEKLQRRYNPES